jgi:hypothetical protein
MSQFSGLAALFQNQMVSRQQKRAKKTLKTLDFLTLIPIGL